MWKHGVPTKQATTPDVQAADPSEGTIDSNGSAGVGESAIAGSAGAALGVGTFTENMFTADTFASDTYAVKVMLLLRTCVVVPPTWESDPRLDRARVDPGAFVGGGGSRC